MAISGIQDAYFIPFENLHFCVICYATCWCSVVWLLSSIFTGYELIKMYICCNKPFISPVHSFILKSYCLFIILAVLHSVSAHIYKRTSGVNEESFDVIMNMAIDRYLKFCKQVVSFILSGENHPLHSNTTVCIASSRVKCN